MKTKAEIEKLSPEQSRVATALASGFAWAVQARMHTIHESWDVPKELLERTLVRKEEIGGLYYELAEGSEKLDSNFLIHVPDYPSDLNAMAVAEKTMSKPKLGIYHTVLCDIYEELSKESDDIGIRLGNSRSNRALAISATAQQRNLAFLMVMMEDKE